MLPILCVALASLAGDLRVPGRVHLEPGTPGDEALTVVARSSERFAEPPQEDPRRTSAAVDEGGRFELVFAAGSKRGWVELEGRYSYLERRARVDLDPLPELVELRPRLGGLLRVELALPEGVSAESLAGARATLSPATGVGPPLRAGVAPGADGRIELLALEPREGMELELEAPGYVRVVRPEIEVRAGRVTELRVELRREVRLVGRVVDPDGAGVEGARVEARVAIDPRDQGAHRWASTEADGAFELGGLAAGRTTLSVRAPGFLLESKQLGSLAEGALVDELAIVLDPGRPIAGRVLRPDGEPAAGATVSVDLGATRIAETAADEQGAFSFSGLSDARHTLRANGAIGGQAAVSERVEARPGLGGVELVLVPITPARGRVLDAEDRPVTSFQVVAVPRGQSAQAERARFEDEGGRFELALDPGEWRLSASADGFAALREASVTVPGDAGELVLRLIRTASVSGVVLSPSGEPVARANVELELDARGRPVDVGRQEQPQLSDAEGRFTLGFLPPGRGFVVARADGFGASLPLRVDLAPGDERTDLVLRLRAAARLTGELHASIEPRERCFVAIYPSAEAFGTETTDLHRLATDRRGRFEAGELAPGRYEVTCILGGEPDSRELVVGPIELVEGGSAHVVLGEPSHERVLLAGRVLRDGEPLGGVRVTCVREGLAHSQRAVFGAADALGRYELELERPGTYRVSADRDGRTAVERLVVVPSVACFELDLEVDSARLAGVVRDPAGAPVGGVQLLLELSTAGREAFGGGLSRIDETDAAGRFAFERLPAGEYELRCGGRPFRARGLAPEAALHGRVARGGLALDSGGSIEDLVLTLPPPGAIEGRIVSKAGPSPVAASVEVHDANGVPLERWPIRADVTGRFRIAGLAAGTVRLRATQDDERGLWREIVVVPGTTLAVALEL